MVFSWAFEGLTTFRGQNTSPSSGCALSTRLPARPEDGDGVSPRNVVKPSCPNTALVEFCRRESCKTYIYLLVFKIAKIGQVFAEFAGRSLKSFFITPVLGFIVTLLEWEEPRICACLSNHYPETHLDVITHPNELIPAILEEEGPIRLKRFKPTELTRRFS